MNASVGRLSVLGVLALVIWLWRPGRAGVTNPDISVVGQPLLRSTDDAGNPDRKRLQFDVGETEFVFDAYLNPYAKGLFTVALADEGIEVEEGFFSIVRGLPAGLSLKGGKYRVGFGKLNPFHPHAYPFAERFRVLAAYLPGDESFNETGVSLANRIPIVGDFSVNASVDWLQGNSFRIERKPQAEMDSLNQGGNDDADLTRPAVLGRLSGFTMVGEQSALEFGLSGTHGTNNVAAKSRTTVVGADVKAKLWTSPRANLLIQAEGLHLHRDDAAWSEGEYSSSEVSPSGGYVFANYSFGIRYNVGGSYERYQQPTAEKPWDQALGLFVGYALLEETTLFHLDWNHFVPDNGDAVNTLTLRVIYSMGPHKAHQF